MVDSLSPYRNSRQLSNGRFYKLGRVYFIGYFEQISYLFRGRYAGIATEER